MEVRDGRGKINTPSGVVPFEASPDEVFKYAYTTAIQGLMARGPSCPGPFRILRIILERVEG